MKSNLETRLSKLEKNQSSFSRELMMERIRKMTPEQREKRIAELKKKGGLENEFRLFDLEGEKK
jgi:hypothetical protein